MDDGNFKFWRVYDSTTKDDSVSNVTLFKNRNTRMFTSMCTNFVKQITSLASLT